MNDPHTRYSENLEKPTLINMLVEKDREIAKLQLHLINLQKGIYGTKSEKLSTLASQGSLFESQVIPPVTTPPVTIAAHTRAARVKRDLSKLPHVRVVHEPRSTTCACCGEALVKIGEDISEELEHQPAKLFVNEHVRPRYACNHCKGSAVKQAVLPDSVKPLPRSIVGAGLLSQIIVSKYVDHLPLHRQEQIFARLGFQIPRKSMCEWIEGAEQHYLSRLWHLLKAELLTQNYLQADETTIQVQDGITPGECHQGYLWGAFSPEKNIVMFEYAPSRAGAVAATIFDGYEGALQTDAYAGYNKVILPDKVTRIACLAHVRRKFIEAEKSCSKESTVILKLISELYGFENKWKGLSPPERKVQRVKHSKPILEKLEKYLRELSIRTLPEAPLMKAINYTLNQWDAIMRVLDDGRYQLDNNPIEREMRPIAVGRKNYLFAGSHDGARRAAIIYSLLGTARLHKVNPYEWLKFIFQNVQSYPLSRLHELLPQNWKNRATMGQA